MPTITVSAVHLKPKKSTVVTTDGRSLGCWSDKLGKFGIEANGTYDVEIEMGDYGAVITRASRIAGAPPPPAKPQNTAPISNSGSHSKEEQIWVQGLLQALIKAGEVKNDKQQMWEAIQMLRGQWKHSFGFEVFTPSEAGRRVA